MAKTAAKSRSRRRTGAIPLSTLRSLLPPLLNELIPPNAAADLITYSLGLWARAENEGFVRGVEEAVRRGVVPAGAPGVPVAAPIPATDKAAKKAQEKAKQEEASNACFAVYLEDARRLAPGVPDEVLADALESDESLRGQFQTGYVPGEGARIGALRRVLGKRNLWRPDPEIVEEMQVPPEAAG